MRLFHLSITYLTLLFAAIAIGQLVRSARASRPRVDRVVEQRVEGQLGGAEQAESSPRPGWSNRTPARAANLDIDSICDLMRSPVRKNSDESGPPRITASGLRMLTRLVSPRATQTAMSWRPSSARVSPCLAASNTSSSAARPPPAWRPQATRTASSPASVSKQPLLPHRQRRPPGLTIMCPSSPANPCAPVTMRPSTTMPPPMPTSLER